MLTRGMTAPPDIQLLPDQDTPGAISFAGYRAAGQCDTPEIVIAQAAAALLTHQAAARRDAAGSIRAWPASRMAS
jgi:hypothetical protein